LIWIKRAIEVLQEWSNASILCLEEEVAESNDVRIGSRRNSPRR